jgi:hypothetical protein
LTVECRCGERGEGEIGNELKAEHGVPDIIGVRFRQSGVLSGRGRGWREAELGIRSEGEPGGELRAVDGEEREIRGGGEGEVEREAERGGATEG